MSEAEIHGGSNAVEAKLEDIGFGKDRVDVRQTAPEEGTPVETETVEDQPRNELGQFQGQEVPVEEAPEAEELAPQAENGDPAVAAYLAKYGGNVDKAITAAAHAQRQLGRQSTEVGDLRAQVGQYEGLIDELRGLRGDMQQERANQPLDQATVDWFDQQAVENPYQAAEYARQQNNQMLLQRALGTWKDIDPYGAAVYTNNLQNQQVYQQFEERLAKAAQMPMDSTIHVALNNVRGKNPHFTNYDDVLAETLQKYPSAQKAIESAAQAGNAGELEAAIEAAFALAQGDTLAQVVRTGSTPDQTTTTSEVVAPTVSETQDAPAPLTPSEQMKADMQEEIANHRRGVFVAE